MGWVVRGRVPDQMLLGGDYSVGVADHGRQGATDGEMSWSVRIPHTFIWSLPPAGRTGAGQKGWGQSEL